MDELNCHSSTKEQEIIDFANKHKGKKIELHHENNMYDYWGDDSIKVYDTSNKRQYDRLIDLIKTCYIHGIKCVG